MSEQEKFEAIGKAATEYGEAKAEFALAWKRASDAGDYFHKIGMFFTSRTSDSQAKSLWRGDDGEALIERLPTHDEVSRIVADVLSLVRRKAELAATLKAAGVEPKD
jgi:hypothetical protein